MTTGLRLWDGLWHSFGPTIATLARGSSHSSRETTECLKITATCRPASKRIVELEELRRTSSSRVVIDGFATYRSNQLPGG